MLKQDVREFPVLIVGAGPAGLLTASTLARYGIESLLVERRPGLSRLPRANAASTWTMELLRAWGLEDEVRASAVDAEPRGWIAETLADPAGFEMPASFPSLEQSAAISPSAPAVIGQDELEPIVLRHLRAVGIGEVWFGTELVGVEVTAGGVRATIRDAVNGAEQQVLARYLVAGDGAHSRIRQILGIEMHGPGRVADAITAIFHAPLWDVVENRRYAIYPVSHPDPRGVFVAVSREDRWVFRGSSASGRSSTSPE
jgi:putative polyketide hydroxylase